MSKIALAVLLGIAPAVVTAQTIYKCTSASGSVTYSQTPCGKDAKAVSMDGAGVTSGNMDVTTDRFTGITTYKSRTDVSLEQPLRVITTVNVNNQHEVSPTIAFMGAYRGDWRYLDCHSMSWLVDGRQISTAPAQHAGKVARHGFVIEMVTQALTFEQFGEFAAARRVEYKICGEEHEIASSDLADLKAIKLRIDRDIGKH